MRAVLRLLAPLLGLALAAAGVVLAIEVVVAWTRLDSERPGVIIPWPEWWATLEQVRWSEWLVPWLGIGVAVIGLILALIGLGARRSVIVVDPPSEGMTVTTSPHVLARMVGQRVRAADDVARASVTASRRKIGVSALGWGDPTGPDGVQLRSSVTETVDGLLDEVPLRRRPRVRVTLQQRSFR